MILEDFQMDKPQTQNYLKMLSALGMADKKSVLVLGELNKNVYLSSRNLKNSKVVINSELNTYSISNANSLIFSESAIAGLESHFEQIINEYINKTNHYRKSHLGSELHNRYTFLVQSKANKVEIKKAVEAAYGVTVRKYVHSTTVPNEKCVIPKQVFRKVKPMRLRKPLCKLLKVMP